MVNVAMAPATPASAKAVVTPAVSTTTPATAAPAALPAAIAPALVLGYAQMPEPTIRAGVRELAEAVHAARRNRTPARDGQL